MIIYAANLHGDVVLGALIKPSHAVNESPSQS